MLALWCFSPSGWYFLQFSAKDRNLMLGSWLLPLVIRYHWVPAIVNECVLSFKMHCFAEAWCLHTFLFRGKGEDHAAQSESLCTLQLKCSVHSPNCSVHSPNFVYFAIFLQRAVTKNLNQVYSLKTCVCHTNWQSALPYRSKQRPGEPRWLGLWSSQVVVGFRISKRTTTLEAIEGQG